MTAVMWMPEGSKEECGSLLSSLVGWYGMWVADVRPRARMGDAVQFETLIFQ